MSLLVTDGMLRMALAAARSVGRHGIYVGVGEKTGFTSSAFSKYCKDRWVYPSPSAEPDCYYEQLVKRIEEKNYRVLFPMDDITMGIAIERREDLGRFIHLPIPPTESYRIARDKGLSASLALEAGVDAPKTEFPQSLEDVPTLAKKLKYPLVIKPRMSSGSRGIRIVQDESELIAVYSEIHQTYALPVLQEYIPLGKRYGVGLLYDSVGKLRAAYAQEEVRHFPYPIGPSSAVESIWMPDLVERAVTVMSKLPWYGVAEIEFMTDPRDGIPKFMEINPRFWNSLQLAIQSGADFPWLLYQTATGQKIDDVFEYKVGEKCRNLLPGELLHFATNSNRWSMDPPLWAGPSTIKDDIVSWSDPMPTLGFTLSCARHIFDRQLWHKLIRR
ncbi:carboxylate--amine ligase [Paenibacillus cremeus]|uniref:ATP-grasp domain-containing protein n=1 Tax=Paenibacillus cremeus TaxID=2163881 RepID=A0A559K6G9_9BACL|nr:ATP-grasp domain-containing protein [Paenibacillus cremeus]TVY07706.1 ATP-grasp domain-containing protein [Paenibacillus cremeus]